MSRARNLTTLAFLVAGAAFCIPLVDGYFLSDDFVQLANFARWSANGVLGHEVLQRFVGSIDAVNGFWRPLTYATFAANYVVGGADARGWLAVNLALHLANAMLVGAIVRRLASGKDDRPIDATFAGMLFFALASGWEPALWIAGRYDSLATFFVLLTGWLFAGGRPRLALVAAALALMSKESGATAIVLVACLAAARESIDARGPLVKEIARRTWPFALLGVAYLALRLALFGNATRAYTGVSIDLASFAHWQALWTSAVLWGRATFPGPTGLRPLAALGAIALLAAGFAASRSRAGRTSLLAILAALAMTAALMLTQVPSLDPSGIGGRLFYLPGALLAIALGLAFSMAFESGAAWRTAAGTLAVMSMLVQIPWWLWAIDDYVAVHREMRAVAAGIGKAAESSSGTPALLLIPDAIGRAPFGRNAQAGLMLPPVQSSPVTSRVLVQLDTEIPDIAGKIARGVFDFLARRSLFELPPGTAPIPGATNAPPSAYFCWSLRAHRFEPMALPPGDLATLAARIEKAHAVTGCRTPG